MDRNKIATPIAPERLKYHLELSDYPKLNLDSLICGFTHGFPLGHDDTHLHTHTKIQLSNMSPNLLHHVEDKIDMELKAERLSGPFTYPPYKKFKVSPISLKVKSTTGKYRLLHNLSHPYDGSAVNANIAEHYKSVKYTNISQAIDILTRMPRGSYSAKSDIQDAFKIIPVKPTDQAKLGFIVNNNYYSDRTLPQGCSSSCQIFERFSTALNHIVKYHIPGCEILHYLDDFLIIASTETLCASYLDTFIHLCKDIGVPLSPSKTTKPSTNTVFLGVELDTTARCAKLPRDKLTLYSREIEKILSRRSITKCHLQSIVGQLNFASCVVPGRPFLRRLINLINTVKLPSHFIFLNLEIREDLKTWKLFLDRYNGISFFRYRQYISTNDLHMYSDACKLGFGATFKNYWIQDQYPLAWQNMHITVLEIYPIFILLSIFGSHISNSNVLFFCDNSSVCHIINKQSSKHPFIMKVVRSLFLLLVKHIHLKVQTYSWN